ncbi:MAG TPA: aspartate--tRNA ligase, partial [Actinomycetota bacterium]|nr:aspartate--tRNA ligase [Actinomycetota bacterium]
MQTTMRSHACGELRAEHVGSVVTLCGWVWRQRDHGGVTFVDLRDREGLVQLVFHPEQSPEAHATAQAFKPESVVRVVGEVGARPEGTVNAQLPTGEVEVAVQSVEVLSAADTPPFPIEDRIESSEELRLRYRYLDLRRPEMSRVLRLRHDVNRIVRDHMESLGFLEIETPYLTRSTPEGARDFLVPSRLWEGTFYALPQSPQQLKQLLMVAGQDRYYQIVRCFRDENPRADRGFEFTQLDVEMSFVTEEDVIAVIEPLMARIVRETQGVEVPTPFPRMTYREMQDRYGSDKPDLRYGMELVDLGSVFEATGFRAFASVLEAGGVVKGFAAPGAAQTSRKEHEQLTQI